MTIQNISRTMSTKFGIFDEDSRGGPSMPMLESLCSKHEKEFNKFRNNVNWMVEEEKVKSFYELTDSDKQELVGMILHSLNDQYEWLSECKDIDMIVGSLAKFMTNCENSDKDYLVTVITANAIKYWGDHIDDFIKCARKSYEKSLYDNHIDSQIEQRLAIGF